jgi:uncharacterized protein
MADSPLRAAQLSMARYLRDPQRQPPPAGVEARRLKIYEDLVFNNIESFINGGFPVLRSLYADSDWRDLVRSFMRQHRCHTPYFLEISQEFVRFLMDDCPARACDPPFIAELAHYEWVELALDIAQDEVPAAAPVADVLAAVVQLSPLAWLLEYQFPVHRIGPGFRPEAPDKPTYLVVYRNTQEQVRFMELNAATARLLELLRDNPAQMAGDILRCLAAESGIAQDVALDFGAGQLRELIDLSVVVVRRVD